MTRRRLARAGSASVPVVLPLVLVRPGDGTGTVAISLDGVSVSEEPVPRVQLGEAIGQIVEQVGAAVRVEIHQPDGAIHADIIAPPPSAEPPSNRRRAGARPMSLEVSGGGFEPEEPVFVAMMVATATADTDGHLTVALDPQLARNAHGQVLAVGARSGATLVRELT